MSTAPAKLDNGKRLEFIDAETGERKVAEVVDGRIAVTTIHSTSYAIRIAQQTVEEWFHILEEYNRQEKLSILQQKLQHERAIEARYEGATLGNLRAAVAKSKANSELFAPMLRESEIRQDQRRTEFSDTMFGKLSAWTEIENTARIEEARFEAEKPLAQKRADQAIGKATLDATIKDIEAAQIERIAAQHQARQIELEKSRTDNQVRLVDAEGKIKIKLAEVQTVAEREAQMRAYDEQVIKQGRDIVNNLGQLQAQIELARATTPEEKLEQILLLQARLRERTGIILSPTSTFEQQRINAEREIEDYKMVHALLLPLLQDGQNDKK